MVIMFRWCGLSICCSCWFWLVFRLVIGGFLVDGYGRGWLWVCGQGEEKFYLQGFRQKLGVMGGVDVEIVVFGECLVGVEVVFD